MNTRKNDSDKTYAGNVITGNHLQPKTLRGSVCHWDSFALETVSDLLQPHTIGIGIGIYLGCFLLESNSAHNTIITSIKKTGIKVTLNKRGGVLLCSMGLVFFFKRIQGKNEEVMYRTCSRGK